MFFVNGYKALTWVVTALYMVGVMISAVAAQEIIIEILDDVQDTVTQPLSSMVSSPLGTVRVLDKHTNELVNIQTTVGEVASWGYLSIQLSDCRSPADNPIADAQAHLTISDQRKNTVVFDSWMLASSPALSALDHPRYDVWLISCDLGDNVSNQKVKDATSDGVGQ